MSTNDATPSRKGRRNLLKIGAAATASTALPAQLGFTSALAKDPVSPTTSPFAVALPVYAPKATETLSPAPQAWADTPNGECGRATHQGWNNWPVKKTTYKLRVKQGTSFLPPQPAGANDLGLRRRLSRARHSCRVTASPRSFASRTNCRPIRRASVRPKSRPTCTTCTARRKAMASQPITTAPPRPARPSPPRAATRTTTTRTATRTTTASTRPTATRARHWERCGTTTTAWTSRQATAIAAWSASI